MLIIDHCDMNMCNKHIPEESKKAINQVTFGTSEFTQDSQQLYMTKAQCLRQMNLRKLY